LFINFFTPASTRPGKPQTAKNPRFGLVCHADTLYLIRTNGRRRTKTFDFIQVFAKVALEWLLSQRGKLLQCDQTPHIPSRSSALVADGTKQQEL